MKRVVFESFSNIEYFLNTIDSRVENSVYHGTGICDSKSGSKSFTGTDSWEESLDLMRTGYVEGMEKLKNDLLNSVNPRTTSTCKNISTVDIVGFAPLVANAIIGMPKSMINSKKINTPSKVISIFYNPIDNGGVDSGRFVTAGAHLLSLIIQLEKGGYRVSLSIVSAFCTSKQKSIASVPIKDHRSKINPLKVSYPILHPSFFRRQMFRWLETNPDVEDEVYRGTYGEPLWAFHDSNIDLEREFLRSSGVLKPNEFYTSFKEAEKYEGKELAQKMGIKIKQ